MNISKRAVTVAATFVIGFGGCLWCADKGIFENASITVGAAESYNEQCKEMLDLLNKHRSENGVAPVKLYITACDLANTRASEIAQVFSHNRPDGSNWYTILDETELSFSSAAENIAYGYPDVDMVMTGWTNSQQHNENMLDPLFTHVGFGIRVDNGTPYWTQIFFENPTGSGSKGDVDFNGTVNGIDASAALAYYAYQATSPYFEQIDGIKTAADVNSDGNINGVDASSILQYYAESSTGGTPSWG